MPLKASQLPADVRTMWEGVKQLQRDVRELRAARSLEKSAVGAGGLTVQDPTSAQRMYHTPRTSRTFSVAGGLVNPPSIEFWSGLASESVPGVVSAFEASGTSGPVPALIAVTGNVGSGDAYLLLEAPDSTGAGGVFQAYVASSSLIMNGTEFLVSLASGGGLNLQSTGATLTGENWNTLTLNNGWTSALPPWQAPEYIRRIDGTVHLVGSALPGTLTSGTVVATLPSAYAPAADLEFRTPGGSGAAYADLVVHGAGANVGQITITNVTGTITRISFSMIRIPF